MAHNRTALLDLGLAVGIAVIVFAYQAHLPMTTRLLSAIGAGLGVAMIARFFLGGLFGPAAPIEEQLQSELDELDELLQDDEGWDDPAERIPLLEQAATLAIHFERWPQTIAYHKELLRLLRSIETDIEEEDLNEFQQQLMHLQLTLAFAYQQNGERDASMQQIEQLRNRVAHKGEENPIFALLIELFFARLISEDDPEKGNEHIKQALQDIRTEQVEEEALHIIAFEWLELGFPEEAITLLEQAHELAEKRDDTEAQTETLYRLAFAHCVGGHLTQAAKLYVELKQRYVYTNTPSVEQLDYLHQELVDKFGLREVKQALSSHTTS
jgi:tetratricopeptide (TPR) repeat protein